MAHLVQSPASGSYWVPTLTAFSITSASGEARLLAWGVSTTNKQHFTVSLAGGWDPRIVCDGFFGPAADVISYRLRGVRTGDVLVLYRNKNFEDGGKKPEWERYSSVVKVTVVTAAVETEAAEKADKLPRYLPQPRIRLFPYGTEQRDPPMKADDWTNGIIAVLDTINANPLGKQVMSLLPDPITIYPYLEDGEQAWSSVMFTASNFKTYSPPGGSADEVLLHEFIHRCEKQGEAYVDKPGWHFSGSDFLTINATNVYSCLLGRALRQDHAGFARLPDDYFDPRKHYDLFRRNYKIAWDRALPLCLALQRSSQLWNPFKFGP